MTVRTGTFTRQSGMTKYRVKVAVKEWIKLTSGYEYPSPGVKIMFITVEAVSPTEARETARKNLALMELEGHVEDVDEAPRKR